MTTNTLSNGIIALASDEGKVLKSDGNIYSTKVYLGKYDKPENWSEVDYSEYEEWQKAEEERMKAEAEIEPTEPSYDYSDTTEPDDQEQPQDDPDELERAKAGMLAKIEEYDTSDNVNVFYMNGNPMWLNQSQRVSLAYSLESARVEGKETTTLWYGGQAFTLNVEYTIAMLHKLEVYASSCFSTTAQHKVDVGLLESVAKVEGYDYKGGYPEKLSINI